MTKEEAKTLRYGDPMTLAAWMAKNPNAKPLPGVKPASAFIFYEGDVSGVEWRKLWRLSDYVVSSCLSGLGVMLLPRATR